VPQQLLELELVLEPEPVLEPVADAVVIELELEPVPVVAVVAVIEATYSDVALH